MRGGEGRRCAQGSASTRSAICQAAVPALWHREPSPLSPFTPAQDGVSRCLLAGDVNLTSCHSGSRRVPCEVRQEAGREGGSKAVEGGGGRGGHLDSHAAAFRLACEQMLEGGLPEIKCRRGRREDGPREI